MQAVQDGVETTESKYKEVLQDKDRLKLYKKLRYRVLKPDDAASVIQELRPQHPIEHVAAIHALAKSGDWEQALSYFEALCEQGFTLDRDIFTAALAACDKGKDWEQALSLLDEMSERELMPQPESFRHVISACRKNGQLEQVFSLFDEMREAGLTPDAQTYKMIIKVCEQEGMLEQALALLEESKKAGQYVDRYGGFAGHKATIVNLMTTGVDAVKTSK